MKIEKFSFNVLRGPQPEIMSEFLFLAKSQGVKTIINLQSGWYNFLHPFRKKVKPCWFGIQEIKIPMSPIFPPRMKQVRQAIEAIRHHKEHGQVYVHCKSGVDRTGAVCAAYLIADHDVGPQMAYIGMLIDGFHVYRFFWWLPFIKRILWRMK